MFRELLQLIREFFAINAEIFGPSRKVEYQEISPEVIAEASRKKEELWQAVVNSRVRFLLFFVTFPIVILNVGILISELMSALLMLVFVVGFTYFGIYAVIVEPSRYRYFRCPRCGSIFREFNKLFPDTDHCRVCKLNLAYRAGRKNQDEKRT